MLLKIRLFTIPLTFKTHNTKTMSDINKNLQRIKQRITSAALRSSRDPEDIRLVAVSKRMSIHFIEDAAQCGHIIFGESYLQEAKEKIEQFQGKVEWHFIGHIQSNKAKAVASLFDLVHTVDRLKLAKALDKHAGQLDRKLSVLLQINVGEEEQKAGVLPEDAEKLIQSMQTLPNLKVCGLMTMPPFKNDPEEVRPYFRALRLIAENFARKGYFASKSQFELSMGMSGDFEIAIEEGATLIRVGTAIFGQRPPLK